MNKRVLIIDDDKLLCEELSEILRGEGFTVEYASTPSEGMVLLEKNTYAALLLDYKMPQMHGIEFLKQIKGRFGFLENPGRKALKNQKLKIILISGSIALKKLLKENGFSNLVSKVLSKPFDIEALLKELKR